MREEHVGYSKSGDIRFLLLLLKVNNRRKRTVLYAAQTAKSWSKEKEKQTREERERERESSFSRAVRKFRRFSKARKTFHGKKSKCLIGNTENIADEYCPPHFKERISIYRRKVLFDRTAIRLLFDFREGKTQWDMFPSFEPIVTSPHGSPTRQTFDKTTDGYRVMPEVARSYPRRCLALYRADGIIPKICIKGTFT